MQSKVQACLKLIPTIILTSEPTQPSEHIIIGIQVGVPKAEIKVQEIIIIPESVNKQTSTTVSQRKQLQDGNHAVEIKDRRTGKNHRAKKRESKSTANHHQLD